MSEKEMILSIKSKIFLKDLRVYLFSSGKNPDEVDEIIEELEDHLIEAEKKGKPIEKIIGNSPKEYIEQLSGEMPFDFKTTLKYIALIILGAFSFIIIGDVLKGKLSYSLLEIIGNLCIIIFFILAVFGVFRYVSKNEISKGKERTLFIIIGLLPMVLIIGLIYLNRVIETPIIHFGYISTVIIGIVAILFMIGISIWAKSWVVIVILLFINLPDYLLAKTTLAVETQLILSMLIMFGGIGSYILITYLKNKDK